MLNLSFSVFKLFLSSLQTNSPEVLEAITLPCLEIIASSVKGFHKDGRKVQRFRVKQLFNLTYS